MGSNWLSNILNILQFLQWIFPGLGAVVLAYLIKIKESLSWPMTIYYGVIFCAALLIIFNSAIAALSLLKRPEDVIRSFFNRTPFGIVDIGNDDKNIFKFVIRDPFGREIFINNPKEQSSTIFITAEIPYKESMSDKSFTEVSKELLRMSVSFWINDKKLVTIQDEIPYTQNISQTEFLNKVLKVQSARSLVQLTVSNIETSLKKN